MNAQNPTLMAGARPWAALALALLVAGCGPRDEAPKPPATAVGTARVTTGPAQPPVLTSGVIATRDELRLSFKMAGIVRRIAVEEGEAVRAGQQLAVLELAEVDAQLEQARQLAEKAERDLARSQRLRADEVISEEELEALRTQAAVAQAALRAAEFNRNFSTIVAARDGVVLRKLVEEREFVQPGQAILVVGPEAGGFIARAGIADRDVVRLRLGDPARVTADAFPGQELPGRVTVLPAAADPDSGLFDIEVELAPPASMRLVSGLTARIRIDPAAAGEAQLPYVPIAAVIEADGDRAAVFVVEEGVARRRPVSVAFIGPTEVAIAEGLAAGATVVTDGALYLEDGEAVRAATPPAAATR
jgi:RND family efflux transporter MFP subunit